MLIKFMLIVSVLSSIGTATMNDEPKKEAALDRGQIHILL